MNIPIPKGTYDILPQDPSPDGAWRSSHLWNYLEETIRRIAKTYGYREIRTPIFERTELFVRGVGESSDIVTKEMYTFEDRAGRSMTLRPEGTAAVMRAYVEKRLDNLGKKQKFFYIGPMFRYERPQAGRYRQHYQFGIESIGDPTPEQDAEVIDMLSNLYQTLGLNNLTVMINSVGDAQSREQYRKALRDFLQPKFDVLSKESQDRFEKNVLRILDSKNPEDKKLLEDAPSILDFLSEEASLHFQTVRELLDTLDIAYQVTPNLVRGLDYYTKTVFEVTSGELGAQNAIGAGGRYDGLISLLGGPDLPSVGFAAGLERILQTMIGQNCPSPKPPAPLLMIIPIGETAKKKAFSFLSTLRKEGIPCEIDTQSKKVGKALEHAAQIGALFAIVIGDEELTANTLRIKSLASREEHTLAFEEISPWLRKHL